MESLAIDGVADRGDVRDFVEYPFVRYADDPFWVPPLRSEELRRFGPRHPFLEYGSMDLFLARRGRDVVGRIAAIDNPRHRAVHEDNVDFFGFFEADDIDAARALLARVEAVASARGRDALWGPTNPSLNETAGVQVRGFDAPPYVLMPHNPPEYETFLERCGYRKAKDLLAWHVTLEPEPPARLRAIAEWTRRRLPLTIRTPNMRKLPAEVNHIVELYDACWQGNWGFVSPTRAEISQITTEMRSVLDKEVALFADVRGESAGFAIALPDYNVLLKILGGRLTPLGMVRSVLAKRKLQRARMTLLGVTPRFRGKGIFAVLVDEIYRRGWKRGYRDVECSWTLEENDEVHAGMRIVGAQPYKNYRIYAKTLSRRMASIQ